jgi:hypothetical protein
METHAAACRWVVTVEALNRIVSPLRSRYTLIRVARPSEREAVRDLEPLLREHVRRNLEVGAAALDSSDPDRSLASAFLLASDSDVARETRCIVRRNRRDFGAAIVEAQVASRRERGAADWPPVTEATTEPAHIRGDVGDVDGGEGDKGDGGCGSKGGGDDDGGDGGDEKRDEKRERKIESSGGQQAKPPRGRSSPAGGDAKGTEVGADTSEADLDVYSRMWPWQRAMYDLVTHIVSAVVDANITLDSYRSMAARLTDEYALAPAFILRELLQHLGRRGTLGTDAKLAAIDVVAHHVSFFFRIHPSRAASRVGLLRPWGCFRSLAGRSHTFFPPFHFRRHCGCTRARARENFLRTT